MSDETPRVLEGVYDIGVGVPELESAVAFWSAFGYAEAERGRLEAEDAATLYGISNGLTAVRLGHQDARQGLIRLLRWDAPAGPGLCMAGLRTAGTRWSVHRTDDLLTVYSHARTAELQGREITVRGPVINARGPAGVEAQRPFEQPVPCSYNLQLFSPLAQIVVMQRQHIDVESYGRIARDALLRVSQACHVAVVCDGHDESIARFYEQAFGLRRTTEISLGHDPRSPATVMFDLAPGERLTEVDLDDPSSEAGHPLPGRLRLFFVDGLSPLPRAHAAASPGQLGYSLYAYRTNDVAALRKQVLAAGGRDVTAVLFDEFGRPSFSFHAPDGYFWQVSQSVSARSAVS